MMMFRRSRLKELLTSSISISNGGFFILSYALHNSTISSSNPDEAPKPQFLVDFLINNLGFTRAAAISASSKVPFLRSTQNPKLVISVFKEYGLDKVQIREIVSSDPEIINKQKARLERKIRVLHKRGFWGSDLVDLLKANPNILNVRLDARIVPVLDFFRRFMCSDGEAIRAIKRSNCLFSTSNNFENMSANVLQLQIRGLSDEQIAKFITKHPSGATSNPKWFEHQLIWIIEDLGIPEDSPMFVNAVYAIFRFSNSTKLLKSYGWSEEEIATFGRSNPSNLALSKAKIRDGLNFFMKELGYTPAYLATHTFLLTTSLEKTVKPRYKILEILKEKKLVGDSPNLTLLVNFSHMKFQDFLKQFENELPGLVETYMNSINKTPSGKGIAWTGDLP